MIFYHLLLLLMPFWQYERFRIFVPYLTVIKLVGILVVIAAAVRLVLMSRPVYYFRWFESRAFFILMAASIVSFFNVDNTQVAVDRLLSYSSFAAYLFATLAFVDSLRRLEAVCYTLLFGMFIASLYVYSDYLRWNNPRPGGVFGDANYYSLSAICVAPLTYTLLRTCTGIKKVFLTGVGISLLASVLLGGSRGGVIALAFCFLYLFLRVRQRGLLVIGGTLVLIPLLVYLPQTGLARLRAADTGSQISTAARMEILVAGLNMIREHPLTGVGIGQFKPVSASFNEDLARRQIAHNSYIEVAAELGIPCCLLFIGILVQAWRRARKIGRLLHEAGELAGGQIALGLETGIASFCVGAFFLSAEYTKYLWMMVFLGLAMQRIIALRQQQETRTAVPGEAVWSRVA